MTYLGTLKCGSQWHPTFKRQRRKNEQVSKILELQGWACVSRTLWICLPLLALPLLKTPI